MSRFLVRRASATRADAESTVSQVERLESRQLLSASPAFVKAIPTRMHGAVVQAVEGASFSGATVANFTADPAGSFTATVDWGDKTGAVSAAVVAGTSGSFTVVGGHDFGKFGIYHVVVKVVEENSKTTTAFSTAKVADAPLTASPMTVTAVRNTAFVGNVATFIDADPLAVATPKATETAIINWGDGTSSIGTVSQATAGGPFTVSGKHTYGVARTFAITVTIHDAGGAKATAVGSAVVSPPTPVTTPSLIGDYKGSVKIGGLIGSFTGSQSFELNITGQDINGITGHVLLAGHEIAGGTFGANGVGELSNGNFEFSQSDSGVTVTISGHISGNSVHVTSGFIKGSGLPFVGSLHGTFTLTKR